MNRFLPAAFASTTLWMPLAALATSGDVDPGFVYPRPAVLEPESTNVIAVPGGYLVIRQPGSSVPQATGTLELTRIDMNGAVDASFGDGGTVRSTISPQLHLTQAAARLADGSFVLGGYEEASGPVPNTQAVLMRFDASGRPDPAFGQDGKVVIALPGDLDRVAAVGEMTDGRIAALSWSRLESFAYECDYHDRATVTLIDAAGRSQEQFAASQRDGYATSSCRTVLTLQTLSNGKLLYGTEMGIVDGKQTLTSPNWRYGPFIVDPDLGLIVSEVHSDAINVPFPANDREGIGDWRNIASAAGYPSLISWNGIAADGARRLVYAGFSTDGGQAGIARFRLDGALDSGWNGDGVIAIDDSGRPGVEADYGLAADIRLIDVQPDGSIVVGTADGIIERRVGGAEAAHGDFVFKGKDYLIVEGDEVTVSVVRHGGSTGAVGVDYEVVDCEAVGYDCTPSSYYSYAEPGVDFEPGAGHLEWADGETGVQDLRVRTFRDPQVQPDRMLFVRLSNPTGGAAILGGPNDLLIEDYRPIDDNSNGEALPKPSGGGGSLDGVALLALLLLAWLGRVARPASSVRSAA